MSHAHAQRQREHMSKLAPLWPHPLTTTLSEWKLKTSTNKKWFFDMKMISGFVLSPNLQCLPSPSLAMQPSHRQGEKQLLLHSEPENIYTKLMG